MTVTTLERASEAVDQLVARVLNRAHVTMEDAGSPEEARVVLHLAHSFADELATRDPRFDRLQFIKDVTEDPAR
jgi:hypothetical protein